jgi:hypothetical protein
MLDEQLAYFYNAKDGNKSYTNYDDEEFQIFDNDNWIRGKITNDERKLNMSSVGSFMECKLYNFRKNNSFYINNESYIKFLKNFQRHCKIGKRNIFS